MRSELEGVLSVARFGGGRNGRFSVEATQDTSVFLLPAQSAGCHLLGVENAPPAAANSPWTVFVLRNPAGRVFVGHTDEVSRFLTTADVDVAKWTRQPGPWPLVWRHDGLTEAAARKYETSLKRDKGTPRFYTRTGLTPPEPSEGSAPGVS